MKKLLLGTSAVLALAAMPAIAGHHEGGEMKGDKQAKMEEMHDKKFEKYDTDGDGVVSKAEFMAHAEEKFGKMDADGDGNITKEESKAFWKAKGEEWKEKHDKMKKMKEEKAAE